MCDENVKTVFGSFWLQGMALRILSNPGCRVLHTSIPPYLACQLRIGTHVGSHIGSYVNSFSKTCELLRHKVPLGNFFCLRDSSESATINMDRFISLRKILRSRNYCGNLLHSFGVFIKKFPIMIPYILNLCNFPTYLEIEKLKDELHRISYEEYSYNKEE